MRPRPPPSQPRLHRVPPPDLQDVSEDCRGPSLRRRPQPRRRSWRPVASAVARLAAASVVSAQNPQGERSPGPRTAEPAGLTSTGGRATRVEWLRVSHLRLRVPHPAPFTINPAPGAQALRQRGRGRPGLREACACSCSWVNTRVRARWAWIGSRDLRTRPVHARGTLCVRGARAVGPSSSMCSQACGAVLVLGVSWARARCTSVHGVMHRAGSCAFA